MIHYLKWTFLQLVTLTGLIILFIITDHSMNNIGTPTSNDGTAKLIAVILFALVSWIYITFYLQIKKHPNLMEHRIWKTMPIILFIIGFLSFVVFLILAMTPLFDSLDQWRGLVYVIMTYSIILLFLFIMSLVHKFSESKHNVLHHTYAWTLAVLIVAIFMF